MVQKLNFLWIKDDSKNVYGSGPLSSSRGAWVFDELEDIGKTTIGKFAAINFLFI